MSSLVNDGTVVWELVNVANSGGSGVTAERADFTSSEWTQNGDNYELAFSSDYLPIALFDNSNNSVMYDVSGNKIVIASPIDGYYYYKLKG